jgi:outer membrane biosynthesis protein TonB
MKIRVSIACLCLMSAVPCAWADAGSKAAKIAELVQITGVRPLLHEVDSKADQEEAVRAWERFYSENVTETDLDSILAYYRSPAGQKDVSASRAALGQVQRYMHEKHAPTAVVNNTPVAAGSGVTSAPRAPDGRVIPSPSSPERCEVTPTAAAGTHASGRSVVCVCTDEKGSLTRDPVIAESSGDPRVDSGAIKMARIDSGRYIPPTVNGQPQSACFRFAIDFSHHE